VVPATLVGHPSRGRVELRVNGQVRQSGDLSDLIWSVPETIACLSTLFRLLPGDLLFTGTPAGVGPVRRGDRLSGSVAGVAAFELQVA
jgi:fumarylpyruvate hydrolase